MDVLHISRDTRSNSFSILVVVTISEYLDFVNTAYDKKGGIKGQRAPLKTRTAQIVRSRLIADIQKGAIIPPIVIGFLVESSSFERIGEASKDEIEEELRKLDLTQYVSIIDGMQRTTALYEASEHPGFDLQAELRVEFWVAEETNSLIYRMLVLNSGQIPWTLRRQIDVVFGQFKQELEREVDGLSLILSDDASRRTKAGQYQADQFVELFILFGLRKTSTSLQQNLAEEFARLDLIESTGKQSFPRSFKVCAEILVTLDQAVSRVESINSEVELKRFKSGRDLFTSHPARIGLVVSLARQVYGLPGIDKELVESEKELDVLSQKFKDHIDFINSLSNDALADLLDFESLDERIRIPSGKVGEFEREFFLKAFTSLITLIKESPELSSYHPLWVA